MAFKMNTSIGKIYAKTQGTKPHAKAIATAKAPTPAKGNVGMPTSPFHVETMGPVTEKESNRKKQSAKNTSDRGAGRKVSYENAYADADKTKYGGEGGKAKFIKDAKAYNAKKKKKSTTPEPTTKVKSQADKDKETKRIEGIMSTRVKMGDNKSKDTKSKDKIAGSDLVGKSKSKRGDKLRNKADNAKSVAEKNRLQNRADRKDGRAERRAARVARRSGNMTKAEAKAKIKESRSKQKSTANRSTAPQSGQINNVKGSAGDKKRKAAKKLKDFKVDKNLGKVDLKSSIDPTNIMSNRKKPVNKYGKDYKIKI